MNAEGPSTSRPYTRRGWLTAAANASAPRSNLALFAFLMGWGVSLHLAADRDWFSSPFHALVAVSAAILVLRSNSLLAVVVTGASWVGMWAWDSPEVFNHTVLIALLFMGLLASALAVARDRRDEQGRKLEERFLPYVRSLVYVLFAFAVLHKLNWAFLDPAVSCGVDHIERIVDRIPLLPAFELDRVGYPLIVGALATEASIPLLLFRDRTRTAGLALAFGFHYLIGFNSLWSFSAPAAAFYVAFLPQDAHRRITNVFAGPRVRLIFVAIGLWLAVQLALGLVLPRVAQRLGLAFYLVSAPILMGGMLLAARGAPGPRRGGLRREHMGLVVLALFVGLSPYLGLGTRANFAMFSNLQTEGPEWNHLFMPRSMRVFRHQDRLIAIDDEQAQPLLDYLDRSGTSWSRTVPTDQPRYVEFEFKRAISEYCAANPSPTRLTLVAGEGRYRIADVCSDGRWSSGNHPVLDKLLRFRVVESPSICRQ